MAKYDDAGGAGKKKKKPPVGDAAGTTGKKKRREPTADATKKSGGASRKGAASKGASKKGAPQKAAPREGTTKKGATKKGSAHARPQSGGSGGKHRESSAQHITDERFAAAHFDARFGSVSGAASKVKVDKRFSDMLDEGSEFGTSYTVDKYGRSAKAAKTESVERFYELDASSGEESGEEGVPKEAEARAAGRRSDKDGPPDHSWALNWGDSSSEEEGEESEEEEGPEEEEEEEVPEGDATHRIAVMNLDWENVKASDLFVLFSSFCPSSGAVKRVSITPSDYGKEMMAKERAEGPGDVFAEGSGSKTLNPNIKNEEKVALEVFDQEKLRKYELSKLKYYFAVVEVDRAATGAALYAELDGMEFEHTSNILDLRFIPEDLEITNEPRETCTKLPSSYEAPDWYTKALQQTTVELTWDADDKERSKLRMQNFSKEALREDDFRAYLAASSDEDSGSSGGEIGSDVELDDDSDGEDGSGGVVPSAMGAKQKAKAKRAREKYASLLAGIRKDNEEQQDDMEITFTPGFTEVAKDFEEKKQILQAKENETIWERMQRQRKEKKLQKRAEKKRQKEQEATEADEPSHRTPGLKEWSEGLAREKKKDHEAAQLELLTLGKDAEDVDGGYDLRGLLRQEKEKKKKKKKKRKGDEDDVDEDGFAIDTSDDRFRSLFDSHHYAIDRTDPSFKETPAMSKLLRERQKKRMEQIEERESKARVGVKRPREAAEHGEADVSTLVASIKSNASKQKKRKKERGLGHPRKRQKT